MTPGLLFRALRESGFGEDLARSAVGVGDTIATVGRGLLSQVKSGIDASVALADPKHRDDALDYAANIANRSSEQSAPWVAPRTVEGAENIAAIGGAVQRVGDRLKNTAPGRASLNALDQAQQRAPGLMALAAGTMGVLNPPPTRGASAVLNVGLKVGDTVGLTAKEVTAALKRRGVKVLEHEVRESGTEPTAIVRIDRPLTKAEGDELSAELRQEAIAQRTDDTGELFGPGAEKWGPFNPEYFLEPTAKPAHVRSTRRKQVEQEARAANRTVTRAEMVDDPATVAARRASARGLLAADTREPLDLEELRRTSLFDRSLIPAALEGHPGVAQTPAVRPQALRPKTRDEIAGRAAEIFGDPENRSLLLAQAEQGRRLGGETYYASSYPVRAALEEAGHPDQFRRVIAAHAGTSPQTALANNFASQSLILSAIRAGVDLNDFGAVKRFADSIAAERGHQKYWLGPGHVENVRNLLRGDDVGLKIGSYNDDLLGNVSRATLDTHESKGATIGSRQYPHYERAKGFDDNEYGTFETGYAELGAELGLRPGQFQASRWFGGGPLTGLKSGAGDWLSTFERMVLYTAEQRGLSMKRSDLQKLAMDSLLGKAELVPYYPKKGQPMPPLTKKVERGFVDKKLLAGLGLAGGAGAYAMARGKKEAKKVNANTKSRADLLREMEQ